MEHTANLMKTNKGLILSFLKVFAMFELGSTGEKEHMYVKATRCINCKKETGLFLVDSNFEEMIPKFVLNDILHHAGMSWIISLSNEMKYEIDKCNHQDWLNKGPWYNTDICSRLHGSVFEDYIIHAITDRNNLMCSLIVHDKNYQLIKMMKAVLEIC